MGVVVDLAEYRERRGWKALHQAVLTGEWRPITPAQMAEREETVEAIRFHAPAWPAPAVIELSQRLEVEGYEPSFTVYDETHLWTEGQLQPYLAVIDDAIDELAAREGIPSWVLRNIPRTDHGSDDGDAESHRGDAPQPR